LEPTFDEEWRERALSGDPQAVSTLAQAMLAPLYSFCLYRVGRRKHLCEEVVQETLLRSIRELSQYDPRRCGNDIFPWLTGLARNEIRRALAHEKGTVSLETLWANMDRELLQLFARLDAQPFSDELLQREETRELVNTAMSQLPPKYRQALEAKYVAGKSVREMAELLKTTEKAVESQLTRAREAFRGAFLALARNLETAQ
jgi:RNA polymerase sigma-70 factor (ECF subfamily)